MHTASWSEYVDRDRDRAVELMRAKMHRCLAVGITGIGDTMVLPKAAQLYRRASAAGKLPFAVSQLHAADHMFAQQDLRRPDLVERIKESGNHNLRGGGIKIVVDRPFPDGPAADRIHGGCSHHTGLPFYTDSEVPDLALRASDLGIAPEIYAMGNCAVDSVLNACEGVRRKSRKNSVLRIEHAFISNAGQGRRMAELSVALVASPGLLYPWTEAFQAWRGDGQNHLILFPMRSMIDAGARVSLSSDHPAGTYQPAEILRASVARMNIRGESLQPAEAISASEALRCYTINAAHAISRDAARPRYRLLPNRRYPYDAGGYDLCGWRATLRKVVADFRRRTGRT